MRTSPVPFDSDALRANLATTAQEVVIPDRYLPLLDAVRGLHGVRAALAETMNEYFHTFRNAELLVDGFQTTLLRNWSYFARSEAREDLFGLLGELVVGLLDSDLTGDQFSLLLRALLTWSADALGGTHADEYDEVLAGLAGALARLVPQHEAEFLERDTLLRNLTERAASRPALAPGYEALFRSVLAAGYRRVRDHLDVPAWALSQGERLTDPGAVAGKFAFLTERRLSTLLEALEAAPDDRLLRPALPVFSTVLGEAIDALFRVENLEDRFAVCLFFLKDETLGYRQKEVMADLLGVVKQMMQPDRHTDAIRILARLTAFFRDRDNEFLLTRFACYEAIGVAVGEAGNVKAADHLIEDILYWKFQYPDIRGATDEWETVVNPYHLPKIRCWMHIIESNPALFERLAAALNVQLKLGGVFIADTDLFQRDVTRFLNADIRPIYFVAKQLLRTLPVYFNEVGAEGELRAVSTQIDEICGRRDTLMHFLRKQVHAESSNRMVAFSREVLRYWLTLDTAGLEPYVSANTLEAISGERRWAQGPHDVLAALDHGGGGRARGGARRAARAVAGRAADPSRARSGRRRRRARARHRRPAPRRAPGAHAPAARAQVLALGRRRRDGCRPRSPARRAHAATGSGSPWPAGRRGRAGARGTRCSMPVSPSSRDSRRSSSSPGAATATENIYQKRHIAAGIPSIYGNYSEPRFDALGLSFRVENLVGRLLDDVVAEGIDQYVTRASLRRMATALRRFERALAADGVDSRALDATLDMLEASFALRNFTFRQYQNVFQFLANSVTELSSTSVLSHEQVLHAVLVNDPRQCEARDLSVDAVAELVLREVLVSGVGLQALDRYLSAALRQISLLNGRLDSRGLTRMMNYDPERLVSPIHKPKRATDDQTTLGFKGLGLKQMTAYGHRVPEGFVLSTELFGAMPAMSYPPLYDDTIHRVHEAVGALERQIGLRLGDPRRLLLLSIRSGAAISMPGLMTTFVNVGLNDELVEAFAGRPETAWAAWDSYRRFLQSWAMSYGIDRDFFDAIMTEYKSRYDVGQKLDFTAGQMREIAFAYKSRARDHGVVFVDDPFAQVVACMRKVLESWDSAPARVYRQYIGVAEEWGTAVVVQRMVFGNLSRESGSGVTFTNNPLEPHSRQVRLFGDFAVRSQGEDLVGGLVFPWPISEAQRLGSLTYRGTEHSLERDFPDIYRQLLTVARDLVGEREFDPQEIEFTFESPAAPDLYILQKRSAVQEQTRDAAYFDTTSPNYGPPVAVGMGVAGGAYSGRVAVNAEQIDRLAAEAPDENIVLLRPDTVPEDIGMITRVSGILTARGGTTSHAAVTAKRLGKTAVVECVDLVVAEKTGTVRLAGRELAVGDWVSIDGRTGNIFFGRIPTTAQPPLPPAR